MGCAASFLIPVSSCASCRRVAVVVCSLGSDGTKYHQRGIVGGFIEVVCGCGRPVVNFLGNLGTQVPSKDAKTSRNSGFPPTSQHNHQEQLEITLLELW